MIAAPAACERGGLAFVASALRRRCRNRIRSRIGRPLGLSYKRNSGTRGFSSSHAAALSLPMSSSALSFRDDSSPFGNGNERVVRFYATSSSDASAQDNDSEKEKRKEDEVKPFGEEDIITLRLPLDDAAGHHVQLREWYKQEGDLVEEQEAVCEVETDAFTYDYVSPHRGYLAKILTHASDDYLEHGRKIALMAEEKDEIAQVVQFAAKKPDGDSTAPPSSPNNDDSSNAGDAKEFSSDAPADDEITGWLRALPQDLSMYAAALKSDGFDSIASLATAEKEDLEELGIKKGHRRIIVAALAKNNDDGEGDA